MLFDLRKLDYGRDTDSGWFELGFGPLSIKITHHFSENRFQVALDIDMPEVEDAENTTP